jgi:hypothetical protein
MSEDIIEEWATKKYPPSQDIDAEQLYVDHGYWQTRLLPKVQRIVM